MQLRALFFHPPQSTGDVDVVWNGRNTEIKTPTKFHAGALNRPLKPKQSDNFLIALRKTLKEPEQAYARLEDWMFENPGKRVWLLHYHNGDKLEEVTP